MPMSNAFANRLFPLLEEIAAHFGVSTVTVRKYLKQSRSSS